MHGKFSFGSFHVLVINYLHRQKFSPLIRLANFDVATSLIFDVSLVFFVGLKCLTLLLLKIEFCLSGCIIHSGCHIVIAIETFDQCWSP